MDIQKLKADFQYLLPKHALTRLAGLLAGAKLGGLTTLMIEQFVKHYQINTKEMMGKIKDYKTFNAFFSRPLIPSARPINYNADAVTYPVDGKISQFGKIEDKFLFQAKNHYYTTEVLLADAKEAAAFQNGDFITIYLSPKDYHRVHIPFDGTLDKMIHVPGDLFSVIHLMQNTFRSFLPAMNALSATLTLLSDAWRLFLWERQLFAALLPLGPEQLRRTKTKIFPYMNMPPAI